jgi:CRISPR-associated protein NE0113 (Cas_NE0113)
MSPCSMHLTGGCSRTFEPLKTTKHAANQICQTVWELTQDDSTAIHASATGGRKTMSIYLTAAMQLFGRPRDEFSHGLVSEEFETHPEFYDIPPAPQELKIHDRHDGGLKHFDKPGPDSSGSDFVHSPPAVAGKPLGWGDLRYSDEVKRAQE